jgi:predicted nucleotidyltransferase
MVQKSNTERTLKVFFENPEKKFNLKEVSIRLNLAHTSVKRELKLLIKENLIKKENEKRGKRNFPTYHANLNESFLSAKKISNEEEIIKSGIVEFLVKETFPNSITLFGSYSRGEDLMGSDIDLFVESSFKELDLIKFERKLKRKINLLFKKDINELKKETRNNIINGRILYGAVKIK